MNHLVELSKKEMLEVYGGKNILEYFVQAVGWVTANVVDGVENVVDACGVSEPGANGYTGCKL